MDPVTFEIAAAGLQSAAEEMGSVLKRSSYSPIIRDMDDFSCALFTDTGDLVAQADYIPAQLGAMSLVVKAVIDRWGRSNPRRRRVHLQPPVPRAMHLPDINIVAPVFIDNALVAWTGTAAHHIDVGGVNPRQRRTRAAGPVRRGRRDPADPAVGRRCRERGPRGPPQRQHPRSPSAP